MSRTSAIAASLLILAAMPLRGEPLGRLFFTPEQRALLDQQRLRNQPAAPGNAPDAAAYSLDGRVHRSSGRDTTWINGTPLSEKDPQPRLPPDQKVGETSISGTGERSDPLQGGRVVTGRPGAPRSR